MNANESVTYTEQIFSKLKSEKLNQKFSTDVWSDSKLAIAASGLAEYTTLMKTSFLNPSVKAKFKTDPGIQMCFLGIAPVQHAKFELSKDEVKTLNSTFLMRGDKFFGVQYPRPLELKNNLAFVNLEASTVIIENNRALFPRITNPTEYLKNTPQQYLDNASLITGKLHSL